MFPQVGPGRQRGIPGVTPGESAQGQDDDLPLTATQRAELDRRLATLDQDRREGVTWASLKAELEQRCPECLKLPLRAEAR